MPGSHIKYCIIINIIHNNEWQVQLFVFIVIVVQLLGLHAGAFGAISVCLHISPP